MTYCMVCETEISSFEFSQSNSANPTDPHIKNKELNDAADEAVENDSLKYITKLIDNIEVLNRDLRSESEKKTENRITEFKEKQ
jgi:hypothetical protein